MEVSYNRNYYKCSLHYLKNICISIFYYPLCGGDVIARYKLGASIMDADGKTYNKGTGMELGNPSAIHIDEKLVQALLSEQFPEFSSLDVSFVKPQGWDNRTFRIGDDKLARLPSSSKYRHQVLKEYEWLPFLSSAITLDIVHPVALGKPSSIYPFHWLINKWIPGVTLASTENVDTKLVVSGLVSFLDNLQRVDTIEAPEPGLHNFYRGGSLEVYSSEMQQAISLIDDAEIHLKKQLEVIWSKAIGSRWEHDPVWLHGDLSAGNILVRDGRIAGIIDFGQAGIGDPACDLAIAWNFLNAESRISFRKHTNFDKHTWQRAMGWSAWKAAIVYSGMTDSNALEMNAVGLTLKNILEDAKNLA